jgi:hypothetical protein
MWLAVRPAHTSITTTAMLLSRSDITVQRYLRCSEGVGRLLEPANLIKLCPEGFRDLLLS